jgi:hypothetical protein
MVSWSARTKSILALRTSAADAVAGSRLVSERHFASTTQRRPTALVLMSEKSNWSRRVRPGATYGRNSSGNAADACGPVTIVSIVGSTSSSGRSPLPSNQVMSSRSKCRPASSHTRSPSPGVTALTLPLRPQVPPQPVPAARGSSAHERA